MKYIIRVFLFNLFALWLTSQLIPALVIKGTFLTFLMAALALSFLMLLVKPILKILFIPVNIMTFGLFSWLVNVIMIYLLTVIMPEVRITGWLFPGASRSGFTAPAFELNYYLSLIAISSVITFISNFLHDISES
jgi:putative membrane protein